MTVSVTPGARISESLSINRWRLGGDRPPAQDEVHPAIRRCFDGDVEFEAFGRPHQNDVGQPIDYLFANANGETSPGKVFDRLRWGGQFVYVTPDLRQADHVCREFHARGGFVVEQGPTPVRTGWMGLPIPWVGKRLYYFVARKTSLVQPGTMTERFTFDVQLSKLRHSDEANGGYAVLKQVPTWKSVHERLTQRFPDQDFQSIADRAHKLVDHVFPVFLTREAAFLQLLQRDLPEAYRHRVPTLIGMEKDERGFVRKLTMNWLRLGGPKLPQLEFARQASDLLRVLHDQVKIVHLDLRLDNVVITPGGVGFVDFGSAVRIGEDLSKSPMLQTLFDGMMSTSQIQRLLGRMKRSGQITARFITDSHGKVDKAIDLFYLAMQMSHPHGNPDLVSLIDYTADSDTARRLSLLTDAVLRPKDPDRPIYHSAQDILSGIIRIQDKLLQAA